MVENTGFLSCWLFRQELLVCHVNQKGKNMLKQQDMTETAAAVLHFLPADKWVTPRMMTRTTGVSEARCQLILTQLVLAGLAKDNGGYGNKFRRCQ
ncbi:hypothetical protein [Escherichia coli]|uniref:hypothetical protein n=1 Tax=Escherichia coli TaxID=562 RepID=UPI00237954A2|nr:hypothetical protein [Escherichia coli]MDD9272554.1 hypothetical protein [Escherichia coli]